MFVQLLFALKRLGVVSVVGGCVDNVAHLVGSQLDGVIHDGWLDAWSVVRSGGRSLCRSLSSVQEGRGFKFGSSSRPRRYWARSSSRPRR